MAKTNLTSSMYYGENVVGDALPVFFDLHSGIFNNNAPGIAITGEPGSGKTFLALMMASISAVQGKTVIALDPKGDFKALKGIESEIGTVRLWDLAEEGKGLLNPFFIGSTTQEKISVVADLVGTLLRGGLAEKQTTILKAVTEDVLANKKVKPSLEAVVAGLQKNRSGAFGSESQLLAEALRSLSSSKGAHLFFSYAEETNVSNIINSGTTVISLEGYKLPKSESDLQRDDMRVGAGIMFLLSRLIAKALYSDKSQPKVLIIDEAQVLTMSEVGRDSITEVIELGRAKSMVVVLATQNVAGITKLDVSNLIPNWFAFKASVSEGKKIVSKLGIAQDRGIEMSLDAMEPGRCLFRDWRGQVSIIQIINCVPSWTKAYDTNPYKKKIESQN